MTCPRCGSPDESEFHTTLDTLTPCNAKAEAKPADEAPKKAPRKRTTKK